MTVSRRDFMGRLSGAAAVLALPPDLSAWARAHRPPARDGVLSAADEYDSYAKIAFNENPYGPPASVMAAMQMAFKYANRYGYPDSGLLTELTKLHGVAQENILMSAGSGEVLRAIGLTYLEGGKKVLGAEPSYNEVFEHATLIKADSIKIPLRADQTQDTAAVIATANARAKEIGFVYLCNPNNPTGRIIPTTEIQQILDNIPAGMPVVIDEAYHHFVDNAAYATSIPLATGTRPVIVTRTFSKIAALAGIRLGYAVAPKDVIAEVRRRMTGNLNALARYAGAAALRDLDAQNKVREITLRLRRQTTGELEKRGYRVVPSEANFFMVHIKRPVVPVIAAFKTQGVLVGRPFPPMLDYLRVSVGAPEEMERFLAAWPKVMA